MRAPAAAAASVAVARAPASHAPLPLRVPGNTVTPSAHARACTASSSSSSSLSSVSLTPPPAVPAVPAVPAARVAASRTASSPAASSSAVGRDAASRRRKLAPAAAAAAAAAAARSNSDAGGGERARARDSDERSSAAAQPAAALMAVHVPPLSLQRLRRVLDTDVLRTMTHRVALLERTLSKIHAERWESAPLAQLDIRIVPEAADSVLASCTSIDLSNNRLRDVPPLAQAAQLRRLFLTSNAIERVDSAFLGGHAQLAVLHLSYNELNALPEAIGQLVSLRELCVCSNRLTALPDSIGSLLMLEHLDASSNCLEHVPDTIRMCGALRTLRLHSNRLTLLPVALAALPSLRTLTCTGNPLRFPPLNSLAFIGARLVGTAGDTSPALSSADGSPSPSSSPSAGAPCLRSPADADAEADAEGVDLTSIADPEWDARVQHAVLQYLRLHTPSETDPRACIVDSAQGFVACAGEPLAAVLHTVDTLGRQRLEGGDDVEVSVTGDSGRCELHAVDARDGTYRITLRTLIAGRYWLRVCVFGEPVGVGPVQVAVLPGAVSAARSQLFDARELTGTLPAGEKLPAYVAGAPVRLAVALRDTFGNALWPVAILPPASNGPSLPPLEAAVRGPTTSVSCAVSFSVHGNTADVLFTPHEAGRHEVCVRCGGEHVNASPLVLHVAPASDSAGDFRATSALSGTGAAPRVSTSSGRDVAREPLATRTQSRTPASSPARRAPASSQARAWLTPTPTQGASRRGGARSGLSPPPPSTLIWAERPLSAPPRAAAALSVGTVDTVADDSSDDYDDAHSRRVDEFGVLDRVSDALMRYSSGALASVQTGDAAEARLRFEARARQRMTFRHVSAGARGAASAAAAGAPRGHARLFSTPVLRAVPRAAPRALPAVGERRSSVPGMLTARESAS